MLVHAGNAIFSGKPEPTGNKRQTAYGIWTQWMIKCHFVTAVTKKDLFRAAAAIGGQRGRSSSGEYSWDPITEMLTYETYSSIGPCGHAGEEQALLISHEQRSEREINDQNLSYAQEAGD